MDIGRLDQRIEIRRNVTTDLGAGDQSSAWATIATLWATARPLTGSEGDQGDSVEAVRRVRFTLRRTSVPASVTEKDVIRWQGRDHNIRYINDSGPRTMHISFDAESGVQI